jgi:CBS domain-containing protein
MRAKDVMTADVVSVGPEAPLGEVAALLAENRISGLPVVGAGGEVLGVVSEADILLKEAGEDPSGGGLLARLLLTGLEDRWKLEARTAGEAMSAPAFTVGPERPVHEVAARMAELGVKRLPVVDEGQRLVGIVTRADLVRAFVRTDAEILAEIQEDIVRRTLWLAPELLTITVVKGDVTIAGHLETKAEAELLARAVERVPGVMSVRSELRWEDDGTRRHRAGTSVGGDVAS